MYSLHRITWAMLLCLLSSTFVSVEIAKGDEHEASSHLGDYQEQTEATDADLTPLVEDGNGVADEQTPEATEAPADEGAEPADASTGSETDSDSSASTAGANNCASAPACDVESISTTLSGKISDLESKVESLVSQLTSELQSKVAELKDSLPGESSCSSPGSPAQSNGNGNGKVQKSFDACVEALNEGNLPDAIQHWESVEKHTFGPTAKATLLKDILFLTYDKSKQTVVNFVEDLLKSSKKFLPSVYEVLQQAMKLNSDNIFSLANTIREATGTESHLYTELPLAVKHITSGKTVSMTYLCKSLQKKLEVHVRDDEMTWEREYWPVVASNTYNLNHTKGAMWTFEALSNGNFHVRNSWFGDYLWIEPNYQNLRTVDETTKSRNGTEFKLTLNDDSKTVTVHSVFYKDAPVVEGYQSRSQRDTFRPLRVDRDQTPIKFNVEIAKASKK